MENLEPKVSNTQTSAAPVTLGQTQPTATEVFQPSTDIPTEREILRLIASNYLITAPPQCKDDRDDFKAYLKEMQVIFTGFYTGSLVITVKCVSLDILEKLWEDYLSGHLGEVVQNCFVTEEILKELNLAELKLKTTLEEEDYKACKVYFDTVRGKLHDCKNVFV